MGNAYERFRRNVNHLNEKCNTPLFIETLGFGLRFKAKSRTHFGLLLPLTFRWNGFVDVTAKKVDPQTHQTIPGSKRVLAVNDFNYVYQLLISLIPNMTPSFMRISDPSIENVHIGICSICLDRKTELVLPCLHAFCELCIEQWCVKDKSCPACRLLIRSLSSDGFLIVSQTETEKRAALQEGIGELLAILEAKQ